MSKARLILFEPGPRRSGPAPLRPVPPVNEGPTRARLGIRTLRPGAFPITRLRELTSGGFSIETRKPVPIGQSVHFEFDAGGGLFITIRATAVYCRGSRPATSGWAFSRTEDVCDAIDQLVDLS